MTGLLNVLNTAEDVTAVGVSPKDFFDWDALEDKIYKSLTTGTVNRTHLFQYKIKRPSILVTRDTVGLNSYLAEQNLRKTMDEETRNDIIRNYKIHLETLDAPGVSPIKQFNYGPSGETTSLSNSETYCARNQLLRLTPQWKKPTMQGRKRQK